MKITVRLVSFVLLAILSISMGPCVFAQGRGSYAAGINYPAGPPTSPTNTNFYLGGISPLEIHYGDFNGDGKLDVVALASCSNAAVALCPPNGSAVVVYLSNGDGTFQAPIPSGGPNLPPSARSMTVGDFNGDGKLDVVVGDDGGATGGGDLTVLLGNGDGTFTQSYQTAINGIFSQAGTLAVGDFNGDGKLDLAVGLACFNLSVSGCSVGAVSIYLGNGNGTLSSPTNYNTVGNAALYPVVGDFNGDGKLDVVAGSPYAPGDDSHSSLTVLLSQPAGSFVESVTTLPFYGLSALAAADLNGDGKLDLAITTYPASLQILSGNGDGTFQSPVGYTSQLYNAITNTTSVVVTDLNNDGKPDLVISGTLLGNNGVQLYLNDGTGNFITGPTYGLGGWLYAPFVAQDFNGDGKIDIVMASNEAENSSGPAADGTISVLLGNGDGTMQGATVLNQGSFGGQSNSAITADVNGDGIPDLIQVAFNFDSTNTQGGVAVSLGTGNGSYGPPVLYPTGAPEAFWVVTGDFNGDGKLDLAVANACSDENCTQGGVSILLGNGDGSFQAPTVFGSGAPLALTLVAGDFNGDGKLDVAVMNQDQPPSVGILLGNGDGTLQPAVITNTSAGVSSNYSIAAGDFNADGKTDLAVLSLSADQSTGLIAAYLSNSDGTLTQEGTSFSSGGTASPGRGFNGLSLAVADVNSDGKLDLVAANSCQILNSNCSAGTLSVFTGNGDGTFQTGPSQTVPDGNFYSLLLADINGDGILDAIATNLTGVAVFPGKGDGSFLAPTVYAGVSTGGEQMTLALADLNIVQPGLSSGATAILVNKAGTYLVSHSSANPSSVTQTIQLTTTASASYLTALTPTGSISYYDGTTLLGTASLTGGTASFNVGGLGAGIHTIWAYYSGDSNFNAHSGTPILQAVTGSSPIASLSTSSLTFATQDVGSSSTAQVVTLTNMGAAMTISGISVGGANPADFTQSTTCGSNLAAEANCMISVTFTPTATGPRAALISITDNAGGSPQVVSLSGTGALPSITLSPAALAFGNQVTGTTIKPKNITLSNPGSGALSISSIAVTGTNSSDFTQTNTCGATVPASGNCTITVTFTPSASGARSAAVTITDNSAGSPQDVTLTGTGLLPLAATPVTLAFGNQGLASTSAAKAVTLKNNMAVAVSLSSMTIGGSNAADFVQSATTCGPSLAATKSCTVSITFTPSVAAAETATLTVTDNATNGPQAVALMGTGVQPTKLSASTFAFGNQGLNNTSAPKTVTLTNNDTAAIALSSIAISGTNAAAFAQSATTCGTSLNGHTSCTISVTFTPATTGAASAALIVTDTAANSPQTVALTGTGVEPVTLSAATLAFGNQGIASVSNPKVVTLKNNNSVPLTFSGIATTGINGADFAEAATTCGPDIAAHTSCTISVTFTPSVSGAETGTLVITDTAGNSPQSTNLTGTGVVQFTLSTASISFGKQAVGTTSAAKNMTVTNNTSNVVAISSIGLAGANSPNFTQSATTCGASLNGHSSCAISFTFSPSAVGSFAATATMTDGASNSPQSVALSGTGK